VTDEDILSLLKFSGPVVGLVAALWSTTQKITYEAEGGAKRLTLQGRVLIGITVVAALISLLSIGFESIIAEQQAQRAQQAEEKQARTAAERQARRKAETAARDQAAALARLEADAKEQKRFLEQRFLIIGAAAAQQRRDAQISMQIAREANQRLSEAERTLAEFERINYPLRSIEAEVTLSLNFEGLDMAPIWKDLETGEGLSRRRKDRYGPEVIVTLEGSDISRHRFLQYATSGTQIGLVFVAPGGAIPAPAAGAEDQIRPIEMPRNVDGPGIDHIRILRITADLEDRTMTAIFSGKYEPKEEGVIQSGDKLSLSDVNRLVPILTIERPGSQTIGRRGSDTLVGVSFHLNGIRRFSASSNFRIADENSFILSPEPPRR
jgi:hypothetical protein